MKYPPLKELRDKMHINKIEHYSEGNTYAIFYFPGKEGDSFNIRIDDDEFIGERIIQPNTIRSSGGGKVFLSSQEHAYFYLGLRSTKALHHLTFAAYQKDIKFSIGDSILFLFEDGEKWELAVAEKGYRIGRDSDGILIETKILISAERLAFFNEHPLKKWRYIDPKANLTYTGILSEKDKESINFMTKMHCYGVELLLNALDITEAVLSQIPEKLPGEKKWWEFWK